jgi:hypothetical protein
MNPAELQKLIQQSDAQMRQTMQQADAMVKNIEDGPIGAYMHGVYWLSQYPTVSWIILIGYSLLWLLTTWHCLRAFQGVDRLTWLVALLGIPAFGILFYWLLNHQSTEKHPELTIYRGTPPPAPAPKTGSNIADEVNASIAESIKQRRQGR